MTLGTASASAGTPPVSATGTVSCTGIVGSLKFTPPLTRTGGSAENVKVKAKATGCKAPASNVTTATFAGKITGSISMTSSACKSLVGPQNVSGFLTVKWNAKAGKAKISPTSIGLFQITGTFLGSNGNVGYQFLNQRGRGSFSGTSFGGEIDSSQSATQISAVCSSKKGLKKLTLDAGDVTDSIVCASGCPYTNLQDAINAVEAATIANPITVAPGTYTNTGNFDVNGGTVDIEGAGSNPSTGTVLDGQHNGAVLLVNCGANLTISGVDITNGHGTDGGGISNCGGQVAFGGAVAIANNVATASGGAIFNVNNGTVTFDTGSRVAISGDNAGDFGGGIFNNNGTVTFDTGSTVIISNNTASTSGGGIYSGLGTVTFATGSKQIFSGNSPNDCDNVTCP